MEIEFTDRYSGNSPSWLRGCFTCEAMGCYPQPPPEAVGEDSSINLGSPVDWKFTRCSDCHGTGRVSWPRTMLRVPAWLWKSACFVKEAGFNWEMSAPRLTKLEHFTLVLKCAFLVDLGLWRP